MGLAEFLKATKPEKVVDEGDFAPFKGYYQAKIEGLVLNQPTKFVDAEHYNLILRVVQTLDGESAENRTLRRNYLKAEGYKTKEETDRKIGDFRNDLFTWGIELPDDSVDAFENAFEGLKDKLVYVRAYHFVGKEGNKIQLWVAKTESDLPKASEKKGVETPF